MQEAEQSRRIELVRGNKRGCLTARIENGGQLAEDFGVQGRGGFYEEPGAIRDVIQNHLFQVLTNLAMEPTVSTDSESIRDEEGEVRS